MLINLVNHSSILGLPPAEEGYLCLVIYSMGLKMLKMVSTKRQNYYRLNKWDLFRDSEKYRACVSVVFTYTGKVEH